VPSGLSPIKPLHRINHVFPLESEVLQSIQQVTIPLIHKFNIYIKHPSAFNPKYIRVAEVKYVKESTRRVLQKRGPRGPTRTSFTYIRPHARGRGQLRLLARVATVGRRDPLCCPPGRQSAWVRWSCTRLLKGALGVTCRKQQAANRLRFLNLSKTYPSSGL
jgi:hypothetical protein